MKKLILLSIFIVFVSGCSNRESAPCPINEYQDSSYTKIIKYFID